MRNIEADGPSPEIKNPVNPAWGPQTRGSKGVPPVPPDYTEPDYVEEKAQEALPYYDGGINGYLMRAYWAGRDAANGIGNAVYDFGDGLYNGFNGMIDGFNRYQESMRNKTGGYNDIVNWDYYRRK